MKSLFILLLFIFTSLNAQEETADTNQAVNYKVSESELPRAFAEFKAPDLNYIESESTSEESEFYYPTLLKRYQEGDTTMTLEDLRFFYYGRAFQEDFNPYFRDSDYNNGLNKVFSKKELSESDYEDLIEICSQAVEKDPFNIMAHNYMGYAYDKLGYPEQAMLAGWRAAMIVNVLESSGDATSIENAIYVINTAHEYALLGFYELDFTGQALVAGPCDEMSVESNDFEIDKLYFNVGLLFMAQKRMFNRD